MIHRDSFEFERDQGRTIRGDVLDPDGAETGVIICHGFKGFARWGFYPHLAERIADAGLRAVAFDFSGSGVGNDRESFDHPDLFARNTYTRELRDIGAVEHEAARRGWLGDRFGLFGHSRGGGVATLCAAENDRVGALVTWSAFANVARWREDEIELWRRRGYHEVTNSRTGQVLRLSPDILDEVEVKGAALNIVAAAGRIAAPWLIVHGADDESVSSADAERLHRASKQSGSELLIIDGAGHTFGATHPQDDELPPALDQATRATVDFFRKHLS
ncbi:MAG: alpha/beta hydrolase family protein [Gemmatimonadaceae bacterium]